MMKATNNYLTESPPHRPTSASPPNPITIYPTYEHTIVETPTPYAASYLLHPLNRISPRPLQWSIIIESGWIGYPRLLGTSMARDWAVHRLVVGIIIEGAQRRLIRLRPVVCWVLPAQVFKGKVKHGLLETKQIMGQRVNER